ncbi:hypothetical protein [uncultured Dokdonia sp.]|uniref:hypothetical protein n=1 Tax=uncultured Dokdonia sp. TaxID=575653 RepID=UPI002610A054|nr:hypothetical protein [uncultured Dokdonia sp.]
MIKVIVIFLCIWYTNPGISQMGAGRNETSGNTNFSGRHCRGTNGLCSINNDKNRDSTNTIITYHTNTITFTIDRSLISSIEETQIVGRPILDSDIKTILFFTMGDDFTFSNTLVSHLKIPSQTIVIKKGYYPVYVTKENLIITFKL